MSGKRNKRIRQFMKENGLAPLDKHTGKHLSELTFNNPVRQETTGGKPFMCQMGYQPAMITILVASNELSTRQHRAYKILKKNAKSIDMIK